MPCGVLGRVADFRQRNIFPLPQISGNTESEPYLHQEWQDWANRGIKALNELSGCANSQFSKKKPTRAQRRVIDSIAKAYRDVGGDFSLHDPPGHSCLQELCTSSHLYETDRSDVQPYAREKVSWPEVKSHPVPLEGCLPHADREWLAAWQEQMLRPMDSHSVEKVQPYIDPILKHNQGEYIGFLKELQDRNMLRFQRAEGHPFMLGIFFVRKKSGKLRLIFDTRLLNQYFNDPPNTDLPSADAFTRLETCENASFYAGSGDLSNAFYTLSVPDDLARRFTLPAIEAGKLGLTHLDGEIVGPGTKLCPYLTVLPMGWSWALHFCQAVMMNAIEISGFSGDRIVGDKRAPVHLSDLHTTCAAGYVDNFLVLGGDRDAVDSGLQKISSTLRGFGLTVHEEVPASLRCDFVGLSFNGEQGLISIKPSRIHKLSRAIHELLLRNFCTGKLLQLILGHVTWALMCRREALSAINAGYAFVNMHYNTPTRLWPKLRQELFWIADILPLCRVRVNVGWSSDVCASDSSPFGYGICQRHINPDIARAVGRQSERWRFRFEDAVDARKHAADSVGITSLDEKPQNVSDFKLDEVINELNSGNNFHEVPHSILKKDDWTVVWSHPWNHEGNILETEALSLVWAIEHW